MFTKIIFFQSQVAKLVQTFLESEIRRRFRGCKRNHRGHSIKFMSDDDLTSRTMKTGLFKMLKILLVLAKKNFLKIKIYFLITVQEKSNVVLGLQLVQIDDPCRAIGI